MTDKIPIINQCSRKGGVGKTTVALAIAREMLASGDVVLIDADILGTEVCDLVAHDPDPPRWELGLLELLTGSTGANLDFCSYLERRLGKSSLPGLPRLPLGSGVPGHELVVVPSTRERGDRATAAEGLAGQFLVLDFAREQLARRLVFLLSGLITQWRLMAILLDNSPLYAGLARLTSELPDQPPVGAVKEHADLFKQISWYNIDVVGADTQDLLKFFADYRLSGQQNNRPRQSNSELRWVLNRHPHFDPAAIGDEDHFLRRTGGCPLLERAGKALEQVQQDPRVLHVGFSPLLSLAQTGRYVELERWGGAGAPVLREHPPDVSESLKTALSSLTLHQWDDSSRRYQQRSCWRDWLDGAGGRQ